MTDIKRYRGCILGLSTGDALGAPVEGLKGGHIKSLYGEIDDYVDPLVAWKDKLHRWRMKALYTDDTQLALVLSDTLVKCRGYNPEYFCKLLIQMAKAKTEGNFGAHRGTGKNFRSSVYSLMDGKSHDKSGLPSAGIGAMMRAAPCGLYFFDEPEKAMVAAIEQGLVTHREPRALVMAAVLAVAVSLAVSGKWDKSKPDNRMRDIVSAAGVAEKIVERDYIHLIPVEAMDRFGLAASGLEFFPRLLELPEDNMVFRQIVAEANRQFPEHKITEPGQGFVMASGLSSLYIALTSTDFETAIKKAVSLGKNTDTMAAIVGAIMGARNGEDQIPEKLRTGLVNNEQVALRGEALFHKSSDGLGQKDIVKMETDLTIKQENERKDLLAKLERRHDAKPPPKKKRKKEKKPEVVIKEMPSAKDRKKKKQKRKRVKAPWKQ
jgi:ADP-ribosyl-[dinitrogen reductase] hydrolase